MNNFWLLTIETMLVFSELKQAFTETCIFYYFNPKLFIFINTYAFNYVLGDIFRQLILVSGQWYFLSFFSGKMILADTQYKSHD